ncbi:outer membrane beta-barrel protein [Flexithrix dorotheae]|uniref:type IX secretion/gliding motility protein PorT/SprT n=1 Tax=Flexithrix dorotheae TaxID=70993 RepID=UPI00037EA14A|nr:outer membrane beta-barrel protein [Flexithrix dorotheae]
MHTANIWNKLDLPWKKIGVITLLFLGLGFNSFAQYTQNIRRLNYDNRNNHYGFQIGLFSSNMNIKHSQHFADDLDSTFVISPQRHTSFSLGFIYNKSLADELWDLRILPNVAFYAHTVDYYFYQGEGDEGPILEKETQKIENTTTFIEIPVLLKYKSVRRKNFRVYLVGGFTAGVGVGGKKGGEDPRNLGLNQFNFEVSYGIGIDGYMALFNFAPELRFSHGLVNMLKPNDNIYTNNLDRITTHKIGLYFNFEG